MRTLRRAFEALGAAGVAAAGCGLLAIVLLAAGTAPLLERRGELRARLAQLRLAPGAATARDESAAAQLARFHAAFPAVGSSAEWVGRLQAAAVRAGITLPAGEYRLEQRGGEALHRYAIVLPVQGSYAQLRSFVDAALVDVPHAALDDIELRRDSAASPQLDARLRFTVYLRGTP